MKVLKEDGKILIYLYGDQIDIDNLNELNDKIRKLFIKLIKRYHISLFGYNIVTIYHNSNYGLIIEIEKMNSLSANLQNIEGISDKYIYCPSGTCLNIPEIHYSSSPLKTEFQIK